jgi:hypothetical protein
MRAYHTFAARRTHLPQIDGALEDSVEPDDLAVDRALREPQLGRRRQRARGQGTAILRVLLPVGLLTLLGLRGTQRGCVSRSADSTPQRGRQQPAARVGKVPTKAHIGTHTISAVFAARAALQYACRCLIASVTRRGQRREYVRHHGERRAQDWRADQRRAPRASSATRFRAGPDRTPSVRRARPKRPGPSSGSIAAPRHDSVEKWESW